MQTAHEHNWPPAANAAPESALSSTAYIDAVADLEFKKAGALRKILADILARTMARTAPGCRCGQCQHYREIVELITR